MTVEEVGQRIYSLLDERGLTRYKLSQKCKKKLARQTVYNAADGKKTTRIETLLIICEALEISVKDFFSFKDNVEIHLTEDERILIEGMRNMEEKKRERLLGYASSLMGKDD